MFAEMKHSANVIRMFLKSVREIANVLRMFYGNVRQTLFGVHCFFLSVRYYPRQLNTKLNTNKIKLYKWIFFKIFDEKFCAPIEI